MISYAEILQSIFPVTDSHDKVKDTVEVIQLKVVASSFIGNSRVEVLSIE